MHQATKNREITTRPTTRPRVGVMSDVPTDDPNFMTSLARGLSVIQAFSGANFRLTISEVSQKTGFSRGSVRRCLYTLTKLGFAGCDDKRHFFLRPRILALGHSYISSMPLAVAAQPVLEQLSHFLHESCSIAALDGMDVIYIARASVTRIMSIEIGVGTRLPAFCTSMGRVLLASMSPVELDAYLKQVKFKQFTRRTVNSGEKLKQALAAVRHQGYAQVDQELELGLRSMAVPIQGRAGRVVAALNVGTHAQRVSLNEMQNKFLPHLRVAARELGMLLR
jgi:IclR family pca regulon transcriptional regulator